MKKGLVFSAGAAVFLTVLLTFFYKKTEHAALPALVITCGTFAYHFCMRLLVGLLFDLFMHNTADYSKPWYQLRPFEKQFYKRMRVKRWKAHLPSYEPDLFDPTKHTWDEILQAMCQAELVHETIVVLSFVPVFFSHWFGALPVFVITSVAAAAFDLLFVMVQRYNRDRIRKIVKRTTGKS